MVFLTKTALLIIFFDAFWYGRDNLHVPSTIGKNHAGKEPLKKAVLSYRAACSNSFLSTVVQ
jgi:hypothetical protein